MKDLRTRGGVPFGYSIQNGDAVINNEEAEKLLDYFDYFLAGLSMAAAAREAGLACDPATLPHLFFRKEYTGSGLYPSLITEDYRSRLIGERTRRRTVSGNPYRKKVRHVKIHTDFVMKKHQGTLPEDPVKCIEVIYGLIVPKAEPGRSDSRTGGISKAEANESIVHTET